MNLLRCMLAAATLAGGYAHWTLAQNYPARPIRLVVPFPAGGAADVVARVIREAKIPVE